MVSAYILKVDFGGEIRRLKGWPAEGVQPAYADLQALVCKAFGVPAGSLQLKYRDDEGDLCMLEEVTLPDALGLLKASGSNVLRLFVTRVEPLSSSWAAVPDTFAADLASGHHRAASFDDVSSAASAAETASEYGSAAMPDSCPDASPAAFADALSERSEAAEQPLPTEHQPSGCAARQRLEQAKPRLAQGMQRFKHQIAEDFRAARKDMKSAFDPELRTGSECPRPLKEIRGAVGAVAGAVVAGRMVPLRATRLAAEAVAAVSSPGGSEAFQAPAEASEPEWSDIAAPAPSSSGSAAAGASVDHELAHFTQQVKRDFEDARQEIRDAFGCFKGSSASQRGAAPAEVPPDDHREPQPMQQPSQPEGIVPAVASTLAGVTVATTLVPLRAVRLAVAAGRVAMSGTGARAGADASADTSATTGSTTVAAEAAADAPAPAEGVAAAGEVSGAAAAESNSAEGSDVAAAEGSA